MPRKTHMHVRPKLIDVGRGLEPARIPLPRKGGRRPGRVRELSPDGERVEATGPTGQFWRARIAEGSVEEYDPAADSKRKTRATKRLDEES